MNSYLASLLWGIIHVFFLVGSRNRLVVLTEWLWAYVSFRRGARLIPGSDS
jgi:NADH:ubiquinone reductase (H+-translocating)